VSTAAKTSSSISAHQRPCLPHHHFHLQRNKRKHLINQSTLFFKKMSLNHQKKFTILGQDPDVLRAMVANVVSWVIRNFSPRLLIKLLPPVAQEDTAIIPHDDTTRTRCISIGRPGGMEQLRIIRLKEGIMTVGYNLKHFCQPPFTTEISYHEEEENSGANIPADCVILKNQCFSVNYADCTIRWGLYESAKRFVGWPIVPGFDVAGMIEAVPCRSNTNDSDGESDDAPRQPLFQVGDCVFGCTLFGAYSNRILIPGKQLRKIPRGISMEQAAALPAVSLTALYALSLAGYFPRVAPQGHSNDYLLYSNNSILIHSAAGGVGSMLVQMSKILGLSPIVGVVGNTSKVEAAKQLGCDMVIDKSHQDLWKRASEIMPNGYKTIMDANGVSTLQQSYDHLAPTGRLIVFGFHSNLPLGTDSLNPLEWIKMANKMKQMPAFDPMHLTVDNKAVLGFNLSFFADEEKLVGDLFDQICQWLEEGLLVCPSIATFEMKDIGDAHRLIQSGSSVGKIVVKC
jgi:NADPH:quinone reductase-like Zn-dependent oxidoreductase